jgi:hypothetical protein
MFALITLPREIRLSPKSSSAMACDTLTQLMVAKISVDRLELRL